MYEGYTELFPIIKEQWISLTKYVDSIKNNQKKICIKICFIDSFKFLSTSLEKLASYLDKDKLKITRSKFFNLSVEDFDLFTHEGIFSYECTLTEKLKETKLPRELFYCSLIDDIRERLRARHECMTAVLHSNIWCIQ